jgi:hypothetical protein
MILMMVREGFLRVKIITFGSVPGPQGAGVVIQLVLGPHVR